MGLINTIATMLGRANPDDVASPPSLVQKHHAATQHDPHPLLPSTPPEHTFQTLQLRQHLCEGYHDPTRVHTMKRHSISSDNVVTGEISSTSTPSGIGRRARQFGNADGEMIVWDASVDELLPYLKSHSHGSILSFSTLQAGLKHFLIPGGQQ